MKILSMLCAACALIGVASGGVVTGNTEFASDLYGKLKEQPGNLFLSPYSISMALAMTYGGARGDTEAQMAKALHFMVPQAELHPSFAQLQAALDAVQKKGKVKLAVANSLWPQKEYKFLPDYLELCKTHYGSAVTLVDFKGATDAARKTINDWVEDKTNKKIQELFKPGALGPLTRLVLVNAIYFKGDWACQFKKEATKPAPFHLADGTDVESPTMFQTGEFKYGERENAQMLEIPYAGNDLSMLIVLPGKVDGLPALEAKFGAINLAAWTQGMQRRKTRVWLPKFKVTSEFFLNRTLAALGMTDAFTGKADFSGMDGSKNLSISAVVHKAFVEVNEEGTEAAAATGVGMILMSAPQPARVFRADHPFLFLICENKTGNILFLGRVVDPTK
jgi:serpin B